MGLDGAVVQKNVDDPDRCALGAPAKNRSGLFQLDGTGQFVPPWGLRMQQEGIRDVKCSQKDVTTSTIT